MRDDLAIHADSKIFVAGHRGMVGSALVRRLRQGGYRNILTRARSELDLFDQYAVRDFISRERPDYIFIAAARVGGIQANNTFRADFIYENLSIYTNLIRAAHDADVQRLTFLGSSCIYPPRVRSADPRGIPADGATGAHQRTVRHREDRRGQVMRGVQCAVPPELYVRHADQSVRPRGQLRPRCRSCLARHDPQGA